MAPSLVLLPLFISAALAQSNFRCPENDGYFPDPVQCDKYYDCYDGVAEEVLCPDGMVFNPYFDPKREPCDHYFQVECGDRVELQPAQGPSDLCPRLNGWYSHPDPGVCHIFYACENGVALEYTCSSGLWFDEFKGICNWPENTERQDCKPASYALETESGFTCPERADADEFGQYDPHPKYSDPLDCAKFFICLNNVSPREQGCEVGLVYDEVTQQCTSPEQVPECKDYYAFLDDETQDKSRKKK